MTDQLPIVDTDGGKREPLPVVLFGQGGAAVTGTDTGELYTTNTERERNVRVSVGGAMSDAGTRYYGFIDLSDTTGFPHDNTYRIDVSYLALSVDKSSAARGSISLGVITRVDGTGADIAYVAGGLFTQNDSPSIITVSNFAPSQLKCDVVGGQLVHIKTNNVALGVMAVNTGAAFAYGFGFVPAVGDLLIRVILSASGSMEWAVSAFYHGEDVPGD